MLSNIKENKPTYPEQINRNIRYPESFSAKLLPSLMLKGLRTLQPSMNLLKLVNIFSEIYCKDINLSSNPLSSLVDSKTS